MKQRIIIATKVATSNSVRNRILFNSDTKPQRIVKMNAFSHSSKILVPL